jgi:hypothetical protein
MTATLCALSLSLIPAQPMDMVQRFEELARRVKIFQTSEIIYNREDSIGYLPKGWAQNWQECRAEIKSPQHKVADLIKLLENKDPKVRTLAMAALYHREDPQLLPHIAKLIKDEGKTFSSYFGRSRLIDDFGPATKEEFTEQTVGDIAARFIEFWTHPASYSDAKDFDKYWAECKEGKVARASWLSARFERALGGIRGFRKERTDKVRIIRRDLDKLAGLSRDWTILWIGGEYDSTEDSWGVRRALMSDDEILAAARRIGPALLLRLVQGKHVNDDPDYGTGEKGKSHRFGVQLYVLRNARYLLRAEDGEAVLASEKALVTPMSLCVAAAAELRPDRAGEWLTDGYRRFLTPDGAYWRDLDAARERILARGYALPKYRIPPQK